MWYAFPMQKLGPSYSLIEEQTLAHRSRISGSLARRPSRHILTEHPWLVRAAATYTSSPLKSLHLARQAPSRTLTENFTHGQRESWCSDRCNERTQYERRVPRRGTIIICQ